MKSFTLDTAEDYEDTYFGTTLLDIVNKLDLPVPHIKVLQLKKFHKEGLWGLRFTLPARESTEAITLKHLHDDRKRGIDVVMQNMIGRLCERHSTELEDHYASSFGRRDDSGDAIKYTDEEKKKLEPVRRYLQELEFLVSELDTDRTNAIYENDELRAQLKEKDKAFQEQEGRIKAMEEKFEAQDKKFKNQEKRVQQKNKEVRDMKTMLESNDFELDADRDLIEKLRAEKRELQEKIDALNAEVKDYKAALLEHGLTIEEEEVDMEE